MRRLSEPGAAHSSPPDGSSTDPQSLLERRYRQRSLWLDTLPGSLEPRPALPGDITCDVCIVGAGLTGLWTAYYLREHAPDLRVVVLEREIAGFGGVGPQRRLGLGRPRRAIPTCTPGAAAARRPALATARPTARSTRSGGSSRRRASTAASSRPASCWWRRAGPGAAAARGDGAPGGARRRPRRPGAAVEAEVEARVRVAEARGGMWSPHCARVDPARLVRGLADVVESEGRDDLRAHAGDVDRAGIVTSGHGTVRAIHVLRCTEAFTVQLEGQRRRYLPLYSLMVATEPLRPGGLGGARLGGARGGRRRAPPLLLRPAHVGRPDRHRRPRRAVPAGLADRRGATSATTAVRRAARGHHPPALQAAGRARDHPPLGRRPGRAARLVDGRAATTGAPASAWAAATPGTA